jgi:hypothetical protein
VLAFITANRDAIVDRSRRAFARTSDSSDRGSFDGIPAFLDHVIEALRLADRSDAIDPGHIIAGHTRHGEGHNIDRVIRCYGDVCHALTELSIEQSAVIPVADFRVLDRCLDNAIAAAITAYSKGSRLV